MNSTPRNRRRRGRRGSGSRWSAWLGEEALRVTSSCEVCNEPIGDIITAIAKPDSNLPIHFECALEIVSEELNPGDDEKVIYLGKGNFAVVELKAYQRKRLIVRRQVDWEDVETRSDWRMKLRTNLQ